MIAYKGLLICPKATVPELVQQKDNTKLGTWGKMTILRGSLRFYQLTEEGEVISSHIWQAGEEVPFVEPQAWHKVEGLTEDLEWYLEFYCRPEDYPCKVNFPFTFKEGELADYYKGWELVKYKENPGHLHRRDEHGNRIQLRFATMLARKV